MGAYYSPAGNIEEWDVKPAGYFTPEEWERAHPAPQPAPVSLEEAKEMKRQRIDLETSASILAGFDFTVSGQSLRFSYGALDQQNFADSANAATLAVMNVPGVPQSVTWNGYKPDGTLMRIAFNAQEFLAFYMGGALAHKAACMERGGTRKAAVEAAQTVAEVEAA